MSDNIEYKYEILESVPEKAIVKLKADVLGGNDALSFGNIISEISNSSDINALLIDMANVNIVNSSGLGMLISGFSHLKKAGKVMELINVPDRVKKLLQITQFDKIFNL
jgi:anti-sigma B factor antagonist